VYEEENHTGFGEHISSAEERERRAVIIAHSQTIPPVTSHYFKHDKIRPPAKFSERIH